MYVVPVSLYVFWSLCYGFLNFIWAAEKIKKHNYANLFLYFKEIEGVKGVLDKVGPTFAPLVFLLGHFFFFMICHVVAVLQFHFYWLNTMFVIYLLLLSFWNGSCYYMEYFSR